MEILKTCDILKTFGGLRAVDGVSISINEGELVGLIGPNGAGKSTFFNVISGLYKPDGGEIYFSGDRIDSLPPHDIYRKGLVRSFQIPRLFFRMTVLENALVPPRDQIGERLRFASFHKKWHSQEVRLAKEARSVIHFLDLQDVPENLTSTLSGGQMKLSDLCRSLMGEPKLLMLDEPTSGVTPSLAIDIFKRILQLREEWGITFFIIEHRLDLFLDCVERVLVMHRGKIVADGTPEEVMKNPYVQEIYLGAE